EMAGIAGDLRQLAATEVELAKAELGEQVGLARNIAIAGGIALVAAMLGLVFVFVTIMVALAAVMPWPAAALITTVLLFGIAGVGGLLVYTWFKRLTVVPKKTISSVRE